MAKQASKANAASLLAVEAALIAQDDNAEGILVLDLRGVSPVTDYFVIATGTSDRQIRTMADDIAKYGKSVGQRVWRVAGLERADWVVLDFVDVVVHLFEDYQRNHYDLELIWGESPRVDWRRSDHKAESTSGSVSKGPKS